MRGVYAATVTCSVAATLALVAPVALHRMLFRQHRLKTLVSAAHRLAYAGLVLLGLALVGVTLVVFDVVYGRGRATVAGAFAILWVTLPLCPSVKNSWRWGAARQPRRHPGSS